MSNEPIDLLAALVSRLNETERGEYEAICAATAGGKGKDLQQRFFKLCHSHLEPLGQRDAGVLFGQFKRRQKPVIVSQDGQPLDKFWEGLPYPLGLKVRDWQSAAKRIAEGETEPQYPFMMCAMAGVMVRLAALVAVRAYVDSGGRDVRCNRLVVEALRKPADGTWLKLAQELLKQAAVRDAHELAAQLQRALGRKVKLTDAMRSRLTGKGRNEPWQALHSLVEFRNKLIHGERPDEVRLAKVETMLEVAVRGFDFLLGWRLLVRDNEVDWELTGPVPRPRKVRADFELEAGRPTLLRREGEPSPISLSPLLRFSPKADGTPEVELNELYFINAADRERLSYIGYRVSKAADGKQLGAYEEFKALMARLPAPELPPEPRLDFSSLADFHRRLFVGRADVMAELAEQVAARSSPAVAIKAVAGAGKSALIARLYAAHAGHHEGKERWVFHFCEPVQNHNNSVVMLRSLIAQVCDHFGIDRKPWLHENLDKLKDQRLPGLLAKASGLLDNGGRLVLAIDALDEGFGGGGECIPSVLPAFLPDGVVLLLTWRVDEQGANSRVEGELRRFPENFLRPLTTANPLRGLDRKDVVKFLEVLAKAARVDPACKDGVEAVWKAARSSFTSDPPSADPFYLRLLADGVFSGHTRLDRAETFPNSLDELFEEMWMNLPKDRGFLLHRMLVTLALMQDYANDELLAELYTRRNPEQPLTADDVASLRLSAGKLLIFDGDRFRLFHERFRRFLVGEQPDPLADV
jgi:hypothetical protein